MENKKSGRPESKNVFYFPHYTKASKELDLIEYRHKSEGYKAYYKLLEMVADADYHRLSINSKDEKDMFEMGMDSKSQVIDDVINILVNTNRIDRELWESEKVIWMDDFVRTLRPVWTKRGKSLPQKEDSNSISVPRNLQKRKERKEKKEEKENKQEVTPHDILNLFQLFIGNQDVQPDEDLIRVIKSSLGNSSYELMKQAINNYHASDDKKEPIWFFKADYWKYFEHKQTYNFECPECDYTESSDDPNHMSICKKCYAKDKVARNRLIINKGQFNGATDLLSDGF